MKVADVIRAFEEAAPEALQESYDNSGLITGNRQEEVRKILLCLDVTEELIMKAISADCNMIISHHPIVFSGIKKLTGTDYVQRILIKAIKHDIAIYACHTNLDNVQNGVNYKICQKLGILSPQILSPKKNLLKRLITFCPPDHANKIKQAIFDAGAGRIGEYDECSFNTNGTGTFRPSQNTNPFSGEPGKRSEDQEIKIETIYPFYLEKAVLSALWNSHPYEEVAYDIIALENKHQFIGAGMIGDLKEALTEKEFLDMVKTNMKTTCIRHTVLKNKQIKKVAVCGGSGSFLLKEAMNAGADAFITGDFKYHQFFDGEGKILIADIGHFESEQFTLEIFHDILKEKFPTFADYLTETNTNPVFYY
jgi:dinuclear metal center YbgI/SA1388 family protein